MTIQGMREAYVVEARSIAMCTGASPAAIKARVARLAHELADGEETEPRHMLQAVIEIASIVCGVNDTAARRSADEYERRALAITDRELARTAARTTRETPPAYVPPPPPTPAPTAAPSISPGFAARAFATARAGAQDDAMSRRAALNAALGGPRFSVVS